MAEVDPNEFVVAGGALNIAGVAGGFGAPNEKDEAGVEAVGVARGGLGEGFPNENGAATVGGPTAGTDDTTGVGTAAGVVVTNGAGFPNIDGGFGVVDPKTGVVVPDVLGPSPPKNPLGPVAAGAVAALPNIDEAGGSDFGATLATVLLAAPKKSGTLVVDAAGFGVSLGATGAPNENPVDLTAEASAGLAGAEKRLAVGAGAGTEAVEGAEPKLNDLASTFASEIGAAEGLAEKSDGAAVGVAIGAATGSRGGAATAGA